MSEIEIEKRKKWYEDITLRACFCAENMESLKLFEEVLKFAETNGDSDYRLK